MTPDDKRKLYESMGYTAAEIAAILSHDKRIDRMRGCAAGTYPWDQWNERARADRVDPQLAQLGRSLVREFYNHAWDEDEFGDVCGYHDDGAAMIKLALSDPERARTLWTRLLDTDGLRGEWTENAWVPWDAAKHAAEWRALFVKLPPR